jgi:hypothetical protein
VVSAAAESGDQRHLALLHPHIEASIMPVLSEILSASAEDMHGLRARAMECAGTLVRLTIPEREKERERG